MSLLLNSTEKDISKQLKILLAGNPNSGKSTLFNLLTGMRQKTGNFPGVTVEKHVGYFKLGNGNEVEITDLPGTYSLFAKSLDEKISTTALVGILRQDNEQIIVVVADASNLKRSLYLATQLIDSGLKVVLVLNMIDIAQKREIIIDSELLSSLLNIPVIKFDAKKGTGIIELKKALQANFKTNPNSFIDINTITNLPYDELRNSLQSTNNYKAFVACNQSLQYEYQGLTGAQIEAIIKFKEAHKVGYIAMQTLESVERYKKLNELIKQTVVFKQRELHPLTQKLDHIFTHKIWGFVSFLLILAIIFQFVFSFSAYPMEWIESAFVVLGKTVQELLPLGMLNDIIVKGIIAGLSGIVIFIPQIAFLFGFIAILEDSGYMARVSFIMDRLMRKFGLNGKSIIPLISGAACAVPAIIGTRTISNQKERLLTIFVTPLISCSARLPVYTLLIAFVVPPIKYFGFISLQGLILMAFYLIGFVAALFSAWILKYLIKSKERSYFIMEMPIYRFPLLKHIVFNIWDKVKVFVLEAGKVIIAISIVLWVLASFAPGNKFEEIDAKYAVQNLSVNTTEMETKISSEKLQASYAGQLGKIIEPVIKPLGFDWKIGISLITSFAAREVFVGTMATIYSVGNSDDTKSIREKMQEEINPETGGKLYTPAVALSLMLFYAFALQCMSTIAVVYRETASWKWPLIQFIYMGLLAYLASFISYHLLSK